LDQEKVKRVGNILMDEMRSRDDYHKLSSNQRDVVFRQERRKAIIKVFGQWVLNSHYDDFRRELFSEIGKELNRRPRKGGRRTHPKAKPASKPLTLENIGNERTREALRRDLQEERERKQAVKLFQAEFPGVIPAQYH